MFRYPKVPRHGLPFVDDDFWAGEVIATEKADGSLFRFALYEEERADAYSEEIEALNPDDGDIVAGTSRYVRWAVAPDGTVKGADPDVYADALAELAASDREAMRDLHEAYDAPLVWFAEAMNGHLLDYEDAPALLGFDVYHYPRAGRDDISLPEPYQQAFDPEIEDGLNPYNLGWDGFLPAVEAFEVFETVGLTPMHAPEDLVVVDAAEFDPAEMTVPTSQFTDRRAEGVVFRKGSQRVKVRSEAFEEVKDHHHEVDSGGDANAVDRFIAEYATPARIRKVVMKMVAEDGRELSPALIDDARQRVYDDIWAEEWRTIKEQPYPIVNPAIKQEIARKTADVVQQLVENDAVVHPDDVAEEAPFQF